MGVVVGHRPDHLQAQVYYPNTLFTAGTDQPLFRAPFAGELVFVALVVVRAVTGGPATIDFDVIGGASNPLASLGTGAGTVGLVVVDTLSTPAAMALGDVLIASSDGAATGNSEVTVFAEFRST